MKKVLSVVIAGVAVFALSGCGGDSGPGGAVYTDYYITDTGGAGVSDIVWSCDKGTNGTTNNSGHFYIESVDTCDLDLHTALITGSIFLEDNVVSVDNISYACVGNKAHPGMVNGVTGPGGLIDNASHFTSCTLYNLP
jgi:hypothetical protein